MNNLGTFYTNLGKTANKHLNSVVDSANKGFNSVLNSTNTHLNSVTNSANKGLNSVLSSTNNSLSNVHNSLRNIATNVTPVKSASFLSTFTFPIVLFIAITAVAIYLIVTNKDKISASFNNLIQRTRSTFNQPSTPLVDASIPPVMEVTESPTPPQNEIKTAVAQVTENKPTPLINTLLPIGTPEVFNVSKNDYPYYDAEPLCLALGAELATYDQVKEAWSKGADWCNYGWVKGQAAVYPTQEETWNKIQTGPEENRNVCGTVGVNGGYFENPEMKFGVNCFGVKPAQSEHDEEVLMKKGSIPQAVPTLEVDKKMKEFKAHADNLGVLPFNNHKWA